MLAQGLERAQQQRQAFALDRLADEHDPQAVAHRPFRRERGALRIHVNAVGDDLVVAAEEPPRGPRGCLGYGDAHVQAVEHAARAEHVGDPVGQLALGVDVERADHRQPCAVDPDPAQHGRDRLMDVNDVVAAGAQLLVHRRDTVRGD